MDFQNAEAEIKNLKETLKGNLSLIQVKYIIWTDIISEMKSNWCFLMIIANEKSLILECEEPIMSDKKKGINRFIWARRFIDFINSKLDQELEENYMQDRLLYAVEINKMIVRNDLRKAAENKLMEIKEAISQFDKSFDKMTRVGWPSCCGAEGNLFPWNYYENLLVLTKIKVNNRHEKT